MNTEKERKEESVTLNRILTKVRRNNPRLKRYKCVRMAYQRRDIDDKFRDEILALKEGQYECFIKDEDIPFEYSVVRDGKNAVAWSRYLSTKRNTGDEVNLNWLYERCLQEINDDWKIWKEFLSWRISLLNDCNVEIYYKEYDKVTGLFSKCLSSPCRKSKDLWIMFFEWLIKLRDLSRIKDYLVEALLELPLEYHQEIWKVLVNFIAEVVLADKKPRRLSLDEAVDNYAHGYITLSGIDIDFWSSSLLKRYSMICSKDDDDDDIEKLLISVSKTGDSHAIIEIYERLLSDDLQPSSTSLYELYLNYINALIIRGQSQKLFAVLNKCSELFPFKKGEIKSMEILMSIKNHNISIAENTLDNLINQTTDINEFVFIYEFWIRLEELLVQEFIQIVRQHPFRDNNEAISKSKQHVEKLNYLLSNHVIKLNALQLRQEPNNIDLWVERAEMFKNIEDKAEVFADAVITVDHKAQSIPGTLGDLWCEYAELFEGDETKKHTILDRATNVPFKFLMDLENVWIYWTTSCLKCKNVEEAIKLIKLPLTIPDNYELLLKKFANSELPAQAAIFSSKRLWTVYLCLLEVKGDYDNIKVAYETVISIKTATPFMFISYAKFYYSRGHSAEAFSVLERAVDVFPTDIKTQIYDIYIEMALKTKLSNERMRDLFESAIKLADDGEDCLSFFLQYSDFEIKSGFIEKGVDILRKGAYKCHQIENKCILWEKCLSTSKDMLEINATRELYEQCIEALPNGKTIKFLLDFARLEEKEKEFERCRALLEHGSKLLKPAQNEELWDYWKNFETLHGTRESFIKMLKIRRFLEDTMKVDTEEVSKQDNNIQFVKSTSQPKPNNTPNETIKSNTDEIDLGSIELEND